MVLSWDSLPSDVNSEGPLAPQSCVHAPWHSAHAVVQGSCTLTVQLHTSTQPAASALASLLLLPRSSARCRTSAPPWPLRAPQPGRLT